MKQTKKKIKVLHVAPQPPPLGGMVTYIQGLLNSDVFKEFDGRVVRFDYFGKERFTGITRLSINSLNAFILSFNFVFQVLYWRPDIVHIQTNSGFGFYEKSWIAFLAKILGRRTLLHVHGGNFREFYKNSSRLMKKVIRKSAEINDGIITASPQMRDNFLYVGIPQEKISLIGNAVNLPNIFKKYQLKQEITILFLTRIVLAKGIIELIKAVNTLYESHKNIRLRIVGVEEVETCNVIEFLKSIDNPTYIKYIGPVSEEQKCIEFQNSDIFAFPTHIEDQSYAVMEAMSYGLPCVASNVGGVPSLIEDGKNGILVIPKNVESLYNALNKLLNYPSLQREYGLAARKTIESGFTWNIRAKEIKSLYEGITKENNR